MNDDLKFAPVEIAASDTEGTRPASFREDIERLFAEYTESLRYVLSPRKVTEPREQESTHSRARRLKSPREQPREGSRPRTPKR